MKESQDKKTLKNLAKVFYQESAQAELYAYFARIAEMEGAPKIAEIFRNFSESGSCQAQGHIDFLKNFRDPVTQMPIGSTKENLVAALSAEKQSCYEDYNRMALEARQEGFLDIASWMETMVKLKAEHVKKLEELVPCLEPQDHEEK